MQKTPHRITHSHTLTHTATEFSHGEESPEKESSTTSGRFLAQSAVQKAQHGVPQTPPYTWQGSTDLLLKLG